MKTLPEYNFFQRLGLLLLEIFIFAIIVGVVGGIIIGITHLLGVPIEEEGFNNPFLALAGQFIPQLVAMGVGLWICNKFIFQRTWAPTGIVKEGWLKDTSDGYLLSFIMIGIGFVTLRYSGYLSFEGVEWSSYTFFGFLLMFFIQSMGEEVMARSWLIPAVESRFGTWAALLISSGIFSLIHFFNPNVHWVGLLNIFLAGLMLGIFFLKYRNIWFVTGLHAGWNWVQATVFDFNVSGHDVPSIINFNPYGNELISGGEFGFEGSIMSIVVILIVIAWSLWKYWDEIFVRVEY